MSVFDDFERVSRERRCPVCDKHDWCLVSRIDPPDRALCQRVTTGSRKQFLSQTGSVVGNLHVFREDAIKYRPVRTIKMKIKQAKKDWLGLSLKHGRSAEFKLWDCAEELGVSPESLKPLYIGWSESYGAWTFPMGNLSNRFIGSRLRYPDGKKSSIPGSSEGLFIPGRAEDLPIRERLFIAEGPTDTAALLDLGFTAVGRPSCTGGTALIEEIVRDRKSSQVVIVADADKPGRDGAAQLAARLALITETRVIEPPNELDIREWYRRGATVADVEDLVKLALPVGVSVNRVA